MTITMKELLESRDALSRLMAERFPKTLSYRLSRILANADSELKHFNTLRQKLVEQMDTDHGERWREKPATMEIWDREYAELCAVPVSAWGDDGVSLDDLQVRDSATGEMRDADISASDLFLLRWLIVEKVEAKTATA